MNIFKWFKIFHISQVSQMITAMVRTMQLPTGAAASGTITLDQGRNLSSASMSKVTYLTTSIWEKRGQWLLWKTKATVDHVGHLLPLEQLKEPGCCEFIFSNNIWSFSKSYTSIGMEMDWKSYLSNRFLTAMPMSG